MLPVKVQQKRLNRFVEGRRQILERLTRARPKRKQQLSRTGAGSILGAFPVAARSGFNI